MKQSDLNSILSKIHSFDEFEIFKKDTAITEKLINFIIKKQRLPSQPITFFQDGTNLVFAHGKDRVVKIFPPFHKHQFESDLLVLRHLKNKTSIQTPHIEVHNEIESWPYLIMDFLEGTLLEKLWDNMDSSNKAIIIRELGALIHEIHSLPTQGLESIDCHWKNFINTQIQQCITHHRALNLSEELLSELPDYLNTIQNSLFEIGQPVLLTGEYTPMNILVQQTKGVWHITGLIDFGDSMLGKPEYDLLGPVAFLIQGSKQLLNEFLEAYGYSTESLSANFSHLMTALMLLHRYSNLEIQVRIKNWKNKVKTLKDFEKLVWSFENY